MNPKVFCIILLSLGVLLILMGIHLYFMVSCLVLLWVCLCISSLILFLNLGDFIVVVACLLSVEREKERTCHWVGENVEKI